MSIGILTGGLASTRPLVTRALLAAGGSPVVMSMSQKVHQTLAVALADDGAAAEVIAALNSGGVAQAVDTTDSPTFANLTLTGDLGLASGKVVKINGNQVLGARQTAVTPVAVTFSSGTSSTYASPTDSLTISDATTPTVAELLKYCNELRGNIVSLQAVLHAHGLTT